MKRSTAVGALLALFATAGVASAQEITLDEPLAGPSEPVCPGDRDCATQPGVAVTLHGMSGAFIADAQPMEVAPGRGAPIDLDSLAPVLDGDAAFIGSGLRIFFQGEHMRLGGTLGLLLVNRGLTQLGGRVPAGYTMRADTSFGGHFEVFAGGQVDFRPLFPYLDAVGWLDIVHTEYELFEDGGPKVGDPAFNAYAFGVGPRLGLIIPVSETIYVDLAATGGVIGMNRFMFTAGFGFTSGERPIRRESDVVVVH
jgi:hypothetical protein